MVGTSLSNVAQIRKTILEEHNRARSVHNVEPLAASSDLDVSAQKWAEHLAQTDTAQHSTDTKFNGEQVGENLYIGTNSQSNPDEIAVRCVRCWYAEFEKFDYKQPEASPLGYGHFTQVVWKASKLLGLGIAVGKSERVYVVAQYSPAGNYLGQYASNVTPQKAEPNFAVPAENHSTPAVTASSPGGVSTQQKARGEIKTEVFEETNNGKRQRRTVVTETDYFEDGSSKTTKKTTIETLQN